MSRYPCYCPTTPVCATPGTWCTRAEEARPDRPLAAWEWCAVWCAFLIYLLAIIALGVGMVAV